MKKIISIAAAGFLAMPAIALAQVATSTTATTTVLTMPGGANATSTYTPGLEFQPSFDFSGTDNTMPNTTVDENGVMAIVSYPDGPRLIKLDGDDTVYWVSPNNLKIPMHSRAVFLSYHNKDEDVQTVEQDEFDHYQDAKYIWLNGKGGIYKIEGTTKRLIVSQAWADANVDADQIINVNKTDFNSYKTGAKIATADDVTN